MRAKAPAKVLAAIDVGTNAVRLSLARVAADGSLETLHQERDPIRPGEGVFKTGAIPPPVADRLIATLRRYMALCRKHRAQVKAVATSAVREARNKELVVERVLEEAGVLLEVVSGREEARLICLGVLHRKARDHRAVLIDIGGGSTEVVTAIGEQPTDLWSLQLGSVRLTELFDASGTVSPRQLQLMRNYVTEATHKMLPGRIEHLPRMALGSSGTINAVVGHAATEGSGHATIDQLSKAVETIARLGPAGRRKHFDSQRADIILGGAVVLEMVARHLGVASVAAVNRGLREGILVDLLRKADVDFEDHDLTDAAIAMGRRFGVDEIHHAHVTRLALSLFDQLAPLHELPPATRPYLEVAARLHDVGNAISFERHHKHTYYVIQNSDLPGLGDRERELVARIARYHRRAPPDASHGGLDGLDPEETRVVRRLATLLRVADALDRSHRQPVQAITARLGREVVTLQLTVKGETDLETWSVEREFANFKRVLGRRLEVGIAG